MRDVIKLVLIAAGGYLLGREFGLFGAPKTEAEGQPDQQPADATQPREEQPAEKAATAAALRAIAAKEKLNWDQWAYYYRQLTGKPAPAPEERGVQRTDPMPLIPAEAWVALALGEAQ